MRVKTLRISGFKPFPFAAKYTERNNSAEIVWSENAFQVSFALEPSFMNAIIGPNNSGKSSILYALDSFFSNKTKLPENWYNDGNRDNPVIIEITFTGEIDNSDNWDKENCIDNGDGTHDLTVAYVWQWGSSRVSFIRRGDEYRKVGTNDKKRLGDLFPNYRLLPAYSKLSDEINFEKSDLLSDLIKFILEREAVNRNRSIIYKLQCTVNQLKQLSRREEPPNSTAWREIEELERLLSESISSITPGSPNVRIQIESSVPDLLTIFNKGKIYIEDGIQLDFSEHGMGLQRSFVVSILHVWNKIIASHRSKDFIFAIEEPELYLHPHATRVFIKTLESVAKSNQVLFTTHSSEFVNQVPLENVISIRRIGNRRKVVAPDLSSLNLKDKTKVQRYLQEHRSDMLFARAVLLVEGASELYAIPSFAQKLGFDLDKAGVSVAFVNGKQNFNVYHCILEMFGIPHVILADGDGNRQKVEREYKGWGVNDVYVLDEDFEYEIVAAITDRKFLRIYNECRSRLGKSEQTLKSLSLDLTPDNLRKAWWDEIKDKINATIHPDHRWKYKEKKQEIQDLLKGIAEEVITQGHLLPNVKRKRQAEILKRLGKPLVGRVVGELLEKKEIMKMHKIVNAIKTVVDYAN